MAEAGEQLAKRRAFVAMMRARGSRHFIVWRGIIWFGIPWALTMAGFVAYLVKSDAEFAPHLPATATVVVWLLLLLVPTGVVAGVAWGWVMWRIFERKNWFLPRDRDMSQADV